MKAHEGARLPVSLDASHLKVIAMVSMIIDHVTAFLLLEFLPEISGSLYQFPIYAIGRHIGRIAFPIFCFQISEGAAFTRDRKKYALRLLLFAVLSQIPFSLANGNPWWSLEKVNVLFSLLAGLGMIVLYDRMKESGRPLLSLLGMLALCAFCIAANTDYEMTGPLTILTFYALRGRKWEQLLAGAAAFAVGYAALVLSTFWGCSLQYGLELVQYNYFRVEICNLVGFALLALYSGQKGKSGRFGRLFYLVYPLHLLLIAGIRFLLTAGT